MKRRNAIKTSLAFIGGAGIMGMSSFLHSCKSNQQSGNDLFLDFDQFELLDEISEILLPKTESPGAKDAKVAQFLDSYFLYCLDGVEQKQTLSALSNINKKNIELWGHSFLDSTIEERTKTLNNLFEGKEKNMMKNLRSAVNFAFFTSEIGSTKILVHDPIPGDYSGCIDLKVSKGKVWS